ncbi:MAG: rhomboid family intramembrane serine protease [Planctomycetes bacterium]|nr:rhomboid family intramembrane serine protease [Planctomycetota bacterium]
MHGRGYQTRGLGIGPSVTPPIVKNLLIANGVMFLLQYVFPTLLTLGSVRPAYVWQGGYLWQPLTYMWFHAGLSHIAMNMFVLWMFGSPLALAWGARRFLRFYLLCGVGAGVIIATYPYVAVYLLGIQSPAALVIPTLGASGAVYGVLLAYSLTWPERTIMLIFPPVAFRAIWLIPGLFLMTAIFNPSPNVSHIGHLGGVLVGWLYMRRSGHGGSVLTFGQLRNRWRRYRMRQRLRAVRYEEYPRRNRDRDNDKTLH